MGMNFQTPRLKDHELSSLNEITGKKKKFVMDGRQGRSDVWHEADINYNFDDAAYISCII